MAIAPVVIEFLAKGMPQVQQAFKSIQDAAIKAEKAKVVAVENAERTKTETVSKWSKVRERIVERSATMAGQLAKKQASDEAKAASKAADDKRKSTRRAVDDQKRALAELDSWQNKARRQQEAEHRKSEAARQKITKDRIDRTKQAEKDLDSWQRRSHAERNREAREQKRLANEQRREEEKRVREGQRINSARGRVVEAVVGAGARGVVSGLQRSGNIAMNLAGTAAQLGGGFSIADSVMREQSMRKEAAVLSASTILSGAGPGSEHGRAFSTDEVLSQAKAVGIAQNVDPSEVLRGFDEIKKLSGNLEKAIQVMPNVAKLATATGSDLSTTSKLAGNIIAANPNIREEELDKQLRIFTKQGTVGGVELEDFARYGNRITAGASVYGGNKETNEATLGALAQIARQYGSASGPAEAALGAQRFGGDVIKHAGDLKAQGIDVSDGKGTIRDAQGIILDMLRKSGGDVLKLAGMGLGERGVRPLEGAAAIYRNAGGGEKGIDAVKAEFAKYTTGISKKEIDEANKRVLAEQKVEAEMQKLRIAMGEQLLPEFVKMIPALRDLLPALVDVARIGIPAFTDLMKSVADFVKANKGIIDSLAAHPVGTLIAFELSKSFADAALPALLRGLFTGAFNNLKVPVPGGGGGGLPVPPVAAAALATTALVTVSALKGAKGYTAGKDRGELLAEKVRAWGKGDHEYGISPDVASAEIAAARRTTAGYGSMDRLADWVTSPVSQSSSDKYDQVNASQGLIDSKVLQQAISEAAAAGVREGVANGMRSNTGSNGAGRSETIINR